MIQNNVGRIMWNMETQKSGSPVPVVCPNITYKIHRATVFEDIKRGDLIFRNGCHCEVLKRSLAFKMYYVRWVDSFGVERRTYETFNLWTGNVFWRAA